MDQVREANDEQREFDEWVAGLTEVYAAGIKCKGADMQVRYNTRLREAQGIKTPLFCFRFKLN